MSFKLEPIYTLYWRNPTRKGFWEMYKVTCNDYMKLLLHFAKPDLVTKSSVLSSVQLRVHSASGLFLTTKDRITTFSTLHTKLNTRICHLSDTYLLYGVDNNLNYGLKHISNISPYALLKTWKVFQRLSGRSVLHQTFFQMSFEAWFESVKNGWLVYWK